MKTNKAELIGLTPSWSNEVYGRPGDWVTRGRLWRSKGDFGIHGVCKFPILLPGSQLAYQLMLKIHEEAHKSAKITLQRSRSKVWVVKGKGLADKVKKDCRHFNHGPVICWCDTLVAE